MTTDPASNESSPFFRSAWIAYLVIAVIGLIWWGNHHGDIHLGLFVDTETWLEDLLLGVGAGLALVAGWQVGRRFFSEMREVEAWVKTATGPLDGSEIFVLALISGFSEELLFRGAIQSSWGWGWALVIFTILHSGPGRAFRFWTVFALVAGGVFSALTEIRECLMPAIVAHVTVNGINMNFLMRDADASGLDP